MVSKLQRFSIGFRRGWLALFFVCGIAFAQGQDQKLELDPPLSQIFPIETDAGAVRLKFPVLLNQRTILGPNVVLRFIYVNSSGTEMGPGGGPPIGPGPGGEKPHAHQDGFFPTHTKGTGEGPNNEQSPQVKAQKNEMQTEVWTDPSLFREALDTAADVGTTIVYSEPGKAKPVTAEIDLPDGAFLGEVGGHVEVLGLIEDSRLYRAGVRAGDEIRSLGQAQPVASLKDFSSIFYAIQAQARTSGQSYSLVVWRPGESRLITIDVEPPPSLQPQL